MGRELRRVPPGWQHPQRDGNYVPLYEGRRLEIDQQRRAQLERAWFDGDTSGLDDWEREQLVLFQVSGGTLDDWDGRAPDPSDYMPAWEDHVATHFQMYETCSEGTPISPVFESPEAVARWCADNEASVFGDITASYEQWLAICGGPTLVSIGPGMGTVT